MNPWQDRTLVIHVRWDERTREPEVWLSLYDAHHVHERSSLGIRGPVDLDDLPFSAPDILLGMLVRESDRYRRLV